METFTKNEAVPICQILFISKDKALLVSNFGGSSFTTWYIFLYFIRTQTFSC